MSMIERVAKAIELRDSTDSLALARAAIRAMREPTQTMLDASILPKDATVEEWQLIIDAVLCED